MTPIPYRWEGDIMRPLPGFAKRCDALYVVGETYTLAPVEQRSSKSHAAYFAYLHDAWLSLPDHLAMQFPSEDALRKHALIMTGFRHERKLVLSSKEEARKVAAFLRPQGGDSYAIISVHECVVVEWKAMSQSYRAMPKGQFQASQRAVRDWVDDLLGVKEQAA